MVNHLSRFQVNQPNSRFENYVDLNSNITYTPQDIFTKFYNGDVHVTFQTCIPMDGNSSWGRLFVTAIPVLPVNALLQALRIQVVSDFNVMRMFLSH